MKNIKKITAVALMTIICVLTCTFTTTFAASSNDQAIISAQDDKYTPLYTKSPDSSLKDYSTADEASSRNYGLFYTQTTVLALIVGYLIIFKVRGIPHDEKMHRRKK